MPFREINAKMVEAAVVPGQKMYSQRGAMLAYRGDVTFTRTRGAVRAAWPR
ncbi:hypothetical protein Sfulv_42830 [Streptomyces fulvorobeus]|uniref:Uncharacterized protein n=1 Tax=Streptomyces fulvorobeus TaxID=284028 RepID=A0A7J0CAI3_9ACTN|nr:hypothetical protein Sfulv_42830 [Streptomyces fulvorobeus]